MSKLKLNEKGVRLVEFLLESIDYYDNSDIEGMLGLEEGSLSKEDYNGICDVKSEVINFLYK